MTLLPRSIAASSIAWPISSAVDGGGWMVRARIGQWVRATLEQAVVGGFFGTGSFFGSPAAAANQQLAGGAVK